MRSPLSVLVIGLAITGFSLSSVSSVPVQDGSRKHKQATRTQAWCDLQTNSRRPQKPDAAAAQLRSPSFCDTTLASR